jgi:arylsulfatase A-like enzyme
VRRSPDAVRAPNIVLIIADDLGTNDVGWANRRNANDIRTPRIDQLASEGVRLTNFYVQPVCGPSRAALMTGRYPIRLGLQHANLLPEQENGLPRNETTLPRLLQDRGYVTYGVGKWHLGHWRRDLIPTWRGFDRWYGFLEGAQDHFNHTDHCGDHVGLDMWDDDQPDTTQRGVYSTHLFTSKAVQFIKNHTMRKSPAPFFLYLSYSAVHTPLQAPAKAVARFAHLGDKKRRVYAAMLEVMDEGIGNVTDELEFLGLLESSIVVFFSDNGGPTQEGASNWPLRGWKGSLWEGGIRSQAFVWSPLMLPELRGRSWGGLLHVTDIMPTLVGLAGGDPPDNLDGVDFWSPLVHNRTSPRFEILHNADPVALCSAETLAAGTPCDSDWGGVRNAAIRLGDWKLIRRRPGTPASRLWNDHWVPPSGWQPPWRLLQASPEPGCSPCMFRNDSLLSTQICLFNITHDPEERCDLAGSRGTIVQALLKRLDVYEGSSAPARFPSRVPEKCNPNRFNNLFQWWVEPNGTTARTLLPSPYKL